MLTCGSFTLGGLFNFTFPHVWFKEVLYFSLKTYFVEKGYFDMTSHFSLIPPATIVDRLRDNCLHAHKAAHLLFN